MPLQNTYSFSSKEELVDCLLAMPLGEFSELLGVNAQGKTIDSYTFIKCLSEQDKVSIVLSWDSYYESYKEFFVICDDGRCFSCNFFNTWCYSSDFGVLPNIYDELKKLSGNVGKRVFEKILKMSQEDICEGSEEETPSDGYLETARRDLFEKLRSQPDPEEEAYPDYIEETIHAAVVKHLEADKDKRPEGFSLETLFVADPKAAEEAFFDGFWEAAAKDGLIESWVTSLRSYQQALELVRQKDMEILEPLAKICKGIDPGFKTINATFAYEDTSRVFKLDAPGLRRELKMCASRASAKLGHLEWLAVPYKHGDVIFDLFRDHQAKLVCLSHGKKVIWEEGQPDVFNSEVAD